MPAITATAVSTGFANSVTSTTTGTGTPTPNGLELLWVFNALAAGTPNTPTVTGCGLNWVQVATVLSISGLARVTLFRAQGPAPTFGALTIDYAGQTQAGSGWCWEDFAGVPSSGADGADALVAGNVQTQANAAATAASITMNALAGPGNAVAGGVRVSSNTPVAPGSGLLELNETDDAQGSYEAEYAAPGQTTVNWTWTPSVTSQAIAVEIVAALRPQVVVAASAAARRAASW